MKKFLNIMKEFVSNQLLGILLVVGLFSIVLATAFINVIAAIYTFGTILVILTVVLFYFTNQSKEVNK